MQAARLDLRRGRSLGRPQRSMPRPDDSPTASAGAATPAGELDPHSPTRPQPRSRHRGPRRQAFRYGRIDGLERRALGGLCLQLLALLDACCRPRSLGNAFHPPGIRDTPICVSYVNIDLRFASSANRYVRHSRSLRAPCGRQTRSGNGRQATYGYKRLQSRSARLRFGLGMALDRGLSLPHEPNALGRRERSANADAASRAAAVA